MKARRIGGLPAYPRRFFLFCALDRNSTTQMRRVTTGLHPCIPQWIDEAAVSGDCTQHANGRWRVAGDDDCRHAWPVPNYRSGWHASDAAGARNICTLGTAPIPSPSPVLIPSPSPFLSRTAPKPAASNPSQMSSTSPPAPVPPPPASPSSAPPSFPL